MDHDAGVADLASLEGLICALDGVRAVKLAGERGVEVDDVGGSGGKGVQEGRGEDVHPAGADDEAGLLGEDDGSEVGVVGHAGLGHRARVPRLVRREAVVRRRHARKPGPREPVRIPPVRHHVHDPRPRQRAVDERLQVAAVAGDQHHDPLAAVLLASASASAAAAVAVVALHVLRDLCVLHVHVHHEFGVLVSVFSFSFSFSFGLLVFSFFFLFSLLECTPPPPPPPPTTKYYNTNNCACRLLPQSIYTLYTSLYISIYTCSRVYIYIFISTRAIAVAVLTYLSIYVSVDRTPYRVA